MNEFDLKRLALIEAIKAEITGMKIQNFIDKENGWTISFPLDAFEKKAQELRELAYKHNDAL